MADSINIQNGNIKVKINYGDLTKLINDLKIKHKIRVGIIGDKAHEIHDGSNMTNAKLGAVHEFGATINHPGGQPYFIDEKTGLSKFVKKNSELGQKLIAKGQVTKPHTIKIPTRSFLRASLLTTEGKAEVLKFIKNFGFNINKKQNYDALLKTYSTGGKNKAFSENIAYAIALGAEARVLDAFSSGGFGKWASIKTSTLKNRKQNTTPNPLEDTGQLRDSISCEVDGEIIYSNTSDRGGTLKPKG